MFKNAYSGIKKIYVSEILMLIASVVTIVGSVFTLTAMNMTGEVDTSVLIIGAIALVFAIAALVAFILNIVGLAQARKDESGFNTAFMLTFAGIVVSLISGFFGSDQELSNIFSIAIDLIWLLVTCFIIVGIVNLANQVNDAAVAQKGNNLLKLIVSVQVLSIVIKVAGVICNALKIGQMIPAILSIVAGVLTVIYHFLYISLLAKGKKMLA